MTDTVCIHTSPLANPSAARAVRLDDAHAQIVSLLGDDSAAGDSWTIKPLAKGGQATIYRAVGGDNHRFHGHGDVVVKLYRRDRFRVEILGEEIAALAHLRERVDGRPIAGWNVRSPAPLFWSEQAAVLVMTSVPGQSIGEMLARGVTPELKRDWPSVINVIVEAMHAYWSAPSRLYGDFNLNNILLDAQTRTVSFVDPGGLGDAYHCRTVSDAFHPASRDIAYLLYETAAPGFSAMCRVFARRRRLAWAKALARAFVSAVPADERGRFVDEIEGCAAAHLSRINADLSARGFWRRYVRNSASRSVNRALSYLRGDTRV